VDFILKSLFTVCNIYFAPNLERFIGSYAFAYARKFLKQIQD
jgi:hypothetical protein